MSKRRIVLVIGSVLCAAMILIVLFSTGRGNPQETIKIGFIMSGGIDEAGWNGRHYAGVKAACDKLGAELIVKEDVKEFTGQCIEAIHDLVKEGAGMIILSSYNYSEEAQEVVKEYPQIVFYVNSSEYHDINMTSYFARMYQARYMAGIVAGMKTVTGKIGYVAAMENNEVNRGINAFALGVKRVNPEAEVVVAWTETWDDKEKEIAAAEALIEQHKVDVLTYHQNQPNIVEAAEKAGIYSIGYHERVEGASEKYLTSVICNWEIVYEEIIRGFLSQKGNSADNFWLGIEAEAVGLSQYSEEVSAGIIDEVSKAKTEFLSGKDVFSGIIYDRDGNLRCGEKEAISDEILLEQFDWFVEGVDFYER